MALGGGESAMPHSFVFSVVMMRWCSQSHSEHSSIAVVSWLHQAWQYLPGGEDGGADGGGLGGGEAGAIGGGCGGDGGGDSASPQTLLWSGFSTSLFSQSQLAQASIR